MKDRYPALMQNQIFAEQIPAKRTAEFEAKYEKRFGKKAGAPSAAATYDMTTILLNAIASGVTTADGVISYLENMQPFEGYSGLIDFDENGHLPLRQAVVKKFNAQGIAEEVR
jgi:ABC-type branched-subunit amino acid transport system substrate-binding protein